MPRTGSGAQQRKTQGGARAGSPATAYANRSDLNGPKAPSAVPGQPYGAAGAQLAAQAIAPMGTPQVATGPPARPEGMPGAGSMGDIFAPSENPGEDVMSGAALGPGLGPSAFGFGEEVAKRKDMEWAQKYLPAMEVAANGAKGTDSARQIVRLLKAKILDLDM